MTSQPSQPANHFQTPEENLRDQLFRSVVPKRYHNATATDIVPALADWDGESVFLSGGVGVGKTHQAAALLVAHWPRYAHSNKVPTAWGPGWETMEHRLSIQWWNAPGLLEAIRHSYNHPDAAPDHTSCELLVLDDLGAEKPSEWVEERLYTIINYRYEQQLATIVTSNKTLTELGESIGARTASRLRELCEFRIRLTGGDRRKTAGNAA